MKKKLLIVISALAMLLCTLALTVSATHFDKEVTAISAKGYGYNLDSENRLVPIIRDFVVKVTKGSANASWTVGPLCTNQSCTEYQYNTPNSSTALYFTVTGVKSSLVDYGKVKKENCTITMDGATVTCVELKHQYTDSLPYSQLTMVFKVTFTKTPLRNGTISGLDTPMLGTLPDTKVTLGGMFAAGRASATVTWQRFDSAANKFVDVSSTQPFVYGKGSYRAKIVLTPGNKYYFNDLGANMSITLSKKELPYGNVNLSGTNVSAHVSEYSSSRIVLYSDAVAPEYTTILGEFTASADRISKNTGNALYYPNWTSYDIAQTSDDPTNNKSITPSELFTNSTLTTRLQKTPEVGDTVYFKFTVQSDATALYDNIYVNNGGVKISGYHVQLVKKSVVTVNGSPAAELVFSATKQTVLKDVNVVFSGVTSGKYLTNGSTVIKDVNGNVITPKAAIGNYRVFEDQACNTVTSDASLKAGKTYYSYVVVELADTVDIEAFVKNPDITLTFDGYVLETYLIYDDYDDNTFRIQFSIRKHCTVSFVPFSTFGSGTMESVLVESGSTVVVPTPTFTPRAGYEFVEWTLKTGTGRYQPGDTLTVTGDMTLVANYQPITYTVTFVSGGGSGTMSPVTSGYGYYTLPECAFTAPAGKEFKCWSVNGTEYNKGTSIAISGNVTVSAVWQKSTYTVSFDANNGKGTMPDVTGVSEEFTLPACTFTAPDGKRFKAWKVGGKTYNVGDTVTVDSNILAVAVWEDIPAGHTCTVEKVEKVDATCTESGKKAYYLCSGCGKAYENSAATRLIDDLGAYGIIDPLGHNPSDWKHDEFGHYQECKRKGCNEIIADSKESHFDDNGDGECDVCEYTVTAPDVSDSETDPLPPEQGDETTADGGEKNPDDTDDANGNGGGNGGNGGDNGGNGGGNNNLLVVALVIVVILCIGMGVVIVVLLKKKKA